MKTPKAEVQDVFREYGPEYLKNHVLPLNQLKAVNAVTFCRTASMGNHADTCDECGFKKFAYNSCRNRHCPKCQGLAREQWVQKQSGNLLDVPYFHVVFTVPDDLNPLILRNQKVKYDLLFQCANETVTQLAADKKYLGARIGLTALLHTWGQNLMDHPHLHCIVPGGGLSMDGLRWISSRKKFFLPVKVLSRVFRGKFLHHLKALFKAGDLIFPGQIAYLQEPAVFHELLNCLYKKEWVVYCKPPFKSPGHVIRYLGRYTHRVAIANNRIVSTENGHVTFRWKDYKAGSKEKIMTLRAGEFIRRFLMHVLPQRFVKIRHYGFLSNRNRKTLLAVCKKRSGTKENPDSHNLSTQELILKLTGVDITCCPECGAHAMRRIPPKYWRGS
jgi:hypothetical protein